LQGIVTAKDTKVLNEKEKTLLQNIEVKETETVYYVNPLYKDKITVNDLINNGIDSAIFGEVGETLLNTWNYNASTFSDFHNNFQNWTEVVSIIAKNNSDFVVSAESIYSSNSANLDGVAESRQNFKENPAESVYYKNTYQSENQNSDEIELDDGMELVENNQPSQSNNNVSVTYKSGDTVTINGTNYSYYSGYQKPDGTVIHMVADNSGKLYTVGADGALTVVKEVYTNGAGKAVESEATVNSLGGTVEIKVHGQNINRPKSLKIDENTTIRKTEELASSVSVSGESTFNGTLNGSGTAYIENNNTINSDGSLRESYRNGVYEGEKVNGSTFVKATSMNDFSAYLKRESERGNSDVTIQIPQGASVEWDPSSSWGNGYNFDTSKGPVYLRWDQTAASGAGAYKIVDEYGNYTNQKEFTLDGFNTEYGKWK